MYEQMEVVDKISGFLVDTNSVTFKRRAILPDPVTCHELAREYWGLCGQQGRDRGMNA